jgi:hypothetical protein
MSFFNIKLLQWWFWFVVVTCLQRTHGRFCVKSDIFSFGVLLSGKMNNFFYQSEHDEDLLSFVSMDQIISILLYIVKANVIAS